MLFFPWRQSYLTLGSLPQSTTKISLLCGFVCPTTSNNHHHPKLLATTILKYTSEKRLPSSSVAFHAGASPPYSPWQFIGHPTSKNSWDLGKPKIISRSMGGTNLRISIDHLTVSFWKKSFLTPLLRCSDFRIVSPQSNQGVKEKLRPIQSRFPSTARPPPPSCYSGLPSARLPELRDKDETEIIFSLNVLKWVGNRNQVYIDQRSTPSLDQWVRRKRPFPSPAKAKRQRLFRFIYCPRNEAIHRKCAWIVVTGSLGK